MSKTHCGQSSDPDPAGPRPFRTKEKIKGAGREAVFELPGEFRG